VAGKEQIVEFGHLFAQTSRKNLGDEHLWFSLVTRPPRSRFTRLQRCSCCFQLLTLTMLTSAMFYGIGDSEKPNTNALEIGPFTLSPQQVRISWVGYPIRPFTMGDRLRVNLAPCELGHIYMYTKVPGDQVRSKKLN
jgi:hypothetical protein